MSAHPTIRPADGNCKQLTLRLAAFADFKDNPRVENSNPSPADGRILVIVPAHNESQNLPSVMEDLARHVPRADVVVVDDASRDSTVAVALSLGAKVLRLPCNLGVGGAMQTGYLYAARNRYDVAIQFDGDGQHRGVCIAGLLEAIRDRQADLVIGSRMVDGMRFRFHPLRLIGSRLLSFLVSLIVRHKVTDPTSGFRAASGRAIRFFASHYPQTYLGDTVEALVWAGRQGMKIVEVPARMNQRFAGESATGSLKGFWLTMRIILAVLVDCLEPQIREDQEPKP